MKHSLLSVNYAHTLRKSQNVHFQRRYLQSSCDFVQKRSEQVALLSQGLLYICSTINFKARIISDSAIVCLQTQRRTALPTRLIALPATSSNALKQRVPEGRIREAFSLPSRRWCLLDHPDRSTPPHPLSSACTSMARLPMASPSSRQADYRDIKTCKQN